MRSRVIGSSGSWASPALKQKAELAVAAGDLPSVHVGTYATGPGKREKCPLCQRTLTADHDAATVDLGANVLVMHIPCLRAWQEVVEARAKRSTRG